MGPGLPDGAAVAQPSSAGEQAKPDASAEALATEPAEPVEPAKPAEPPMLVGPRRRLAARFAVAFVFGLLAVLAIAAGALAAYESSNAGRILPGVRVGGVDVAGLTPGAAAARLRKAFGGLTDGELVLGAGSETRTISFADVGRRADIDAMVAEAMSVGRDGATLERIASNIRIFFRGRDLPPIVTLERAALAVEIEVLATDVDRAPVDAAARVGQSGFVLAPGVDGRAVDVDAALRAAETLLFDPAAPGSVRVDLPLKAVEPGVTTAEARAARDAAQRIATDVLLVNGSESWTIAGADIRGWISFAGTADGGYAPLVARQGLEGSLTRIAEVVAVKPIDATFLVGDDKTVIGVTNATVGRALDVPATIRTVEDVILQRSRGLSAVRAPIAVIAIEPDLTTAEATKTAPLMEPISQWTTYFPIGIKNNQGANIWIPAADLDGLVVKPGEWFDFWAAIGPVTREHGYGDGGAIINGHTEPQGALAGGICSASTTMFNAALRAGLEMGARRNHYYYIDRYPIGLDATVFQSSSGSVQTMSWRNDTANPILVRSYRWRVGTKGYVKFVLWSVPTGRTIEITPEIVKNVKPASDSTEYTTTLKPGEKKRVEFPVDGKDVWRTVIVRDAAGNVLHRTTYYSHYSRVTGILQVGIAPSPSPTPTPSPTT